MRLTLNQDFTFPIPKIERMFLAVVDANLDGVARG
jgi:hypothetical protein